ncbi:hypothetical protein ACF07S_02505 [Streptomyces sp. NPDC016640]|uniref:hypothetical protein n=1 Tax=Streptomyces sp. NPDC016640 TaxID=3364969 RepID=UPI0036F5FE7E
MGERQNDDGPAGRRRAHPEGAPPLRSGPGSVPGGRRVVDAAGLEALLAAALIRDGVDAGAEQRAVAAFLAAREEAAHRARTRCRDDWRARRRLGGHSLRATLSMVFAGLTLSGVAVAGMGVAGSSSDGPAKDDKPSHVPSQVPSRGTAPSSRAPIGAGPGQAHPPGTAGDTTAQCRAYEQAEGRGEALDATAWKRLIQVAGGAAKVDAYCAERLERATAEARPGDTAAPGTEDTGQPGRTGRGSAGTVGAGASGGVGGGSAAGAGSVTGDVGSGSAAGAGASGGVGGGSAAGAGSVTGGVGDGSAAGAGASGGVGGGSAAGTGSVTGDGAAAGAVSDFTGSAAGSAAGTASDAGETAAGPGARDR